MESELDMVIAINNADADKRDVAEQWKPCKSCHCPACGSPDVMNRLVESSDGAHEDYEHQCKNDKCKNHWWVEGSDY